MAGLYRGKNNYHVVFERVADFSGMSVGSRDLAVRARDRTLCRRARALLPQPIPTIGSIFSISGANRCGAWERVLQRALGADSCWHFCCAAAAPRRRGAPHPMNAMSPSSSRRRSWACWRCANMAASSSSNSNFSRCSITRSNPPASCVTTRRIGSRNARSSRAPRLWCSAGGVLTVEPRARRRVMDLHAYPQVLPFVESIRATLAGDRRALERVFRLDFAGSVSRWSLTLVPLDRQRSSNRQPGAHRRVARPIVEGGDSPTRR